MANRRLVLWFLLVLLMMGVVRPRLASASVDIVYFRSVSNQSSITLEWGTETELDLLGFLIHRSVTDDLDDAVAISPLIPASGTPPTGGGDYSFDDTNVTIGSLYYYWLVSIDLSDTDPSQYSYEGPISASTLGGTTINTPGPTPVGTTPVSSTRTPTPTLTPAASTPLPTTTAVTTVAAASPTSTAPPSPTVTIDLSPTRIPSGTFPQPPTPTRFTFQATATAAAPGSTTNNGTTTTGDTGNPGGSANTGSVPGSQGTSAPEVTVHNDEGNAAVSPDGSSLDNVVTSLGDVIETPTPSSPNGVDVIGQQIASQSQTSGQLPVPAPVTASPALPAISPLVIMGLMVGVVFTFGGAITILFMLRRK